MTGGGGFHAGLATSLLEELSEECKSAGRWVVMADPLLSSSSPNTTSNTAEGNQNQIHRFRQSLNAGLALAAAFCAACTPKQVPMSCKKD